MTIFGFNTDVKHNDTIYHVQTEAHPSDLLVQTLVFIKGQCVGKRTVSYAKQVSQPDFSDQAVHELLKAQHRTVVDSIIAGTLQSVLGTAGEIEDIGVSGLSLTCIKAEPISGRSTLTMHFHVSDAGKPVAGAELVLRVGSAADAPVITRASSDTSGQAQTEIAITDDLRRESAITVQATLGNKSATRKFRFKKPEQT
jgi:hypothetical protein